MMLKYIAAGVLGSALLASAALAEPPGALQEQSVQGAWRASKMVGLSVYNDNNEKIGSVNDLLMNKSGNIKAAVIGVGGFLGMGEHLVAVSFDKIKFSDKSVSSATSSNTNPPGANRPASTTTTGSASMSSSSRSSKWYPDHAVFNASRGLPRRRGTQQKSQ